MSQVLADEGMSYQILHCLFLTVMIRKRSSAITDPQKTSMGYKALHLSDQDRKSLEFKQAGSMAHDPLTTPRYNGTVSRSEEMLNGNASSKLLLFFDKKMGSSLNHPIQFNSYLSEGLAYAAPAYRWLVKFENFLCV